MADEDGPQPINVYTELARIHDAIERQTAAVEKVADLIEAQTAQAARISTATLIQQTEIAQANLSALGVIAEEIGVLDVDLAPPVASSMTLTIQGDPMPLTVDSQNAQAVLGFEDDHGDPVPVPDGATSTATSDNPGVLGVGAGVVGTDSDGNPAVLFPLTEGTAGSSNLSVVTVDASGNPLLGPDGSTPIADPEPISVTVNPGAAAAEVFSVNPGN